MDIIHTIEAKALVELQKKDTAIDELDSRAAGIPARIGSLNAAFEDKKRSMGAAREALLSLQLRKKELELKMAEADEGIRKHQRDLNLVKENNAFKALLSEIENDKKKRDDLETEVLVLLEDIDKASVRDKLLQAEVKTIEGVKNGEVSALEEAGAAIRSRLEAARAERASFAAGISAELLEKYEAIRSGRGGLAVAAAHEDPVTGRTSCGGCHMALTPQKALDLKKHDALAVCADCRRLMYLERTIYGQGGNA